VEEEAADFGGQGLDAPPLAHEGPRGDAVEHAEEEIGGRQELLVAPPGGVQRAEDLEPPQQVALALLGGRHPVGIGQHFHVAVDDLEGGAVVERELEVGADEREKPGFRCHRLGESGVQLAEQRVQGLVDDQEQELVLGPDVVIEAGERELCGARDLANGSLVIPLAGNHLKRRLGDRRIAMRDTHRTLHRSVDLLPVSLGVRRGADNPSHASFS
jgi:hypothetical protein